MKGYLFSSEMVPNVINDNKTLSLEHVEHLVFLSKNYKFLIKMKQLFLSLLFIYTL